MPCQELYGQRRVSFGDGPGDAFVLANHAKCWRRSVHAARPEVLHKHVVKLLDEVRFRSLQDRFVKSAILRIDGNRCGNGVAVERLHQDSHLGRDRCKPVDLFRRRSFDRPRNRPQFEHASELAQFSPALLGGCPRREGLLQDGSNIAPGDEQSQALAAGDDPHTAHTAQAADRFSDYLPRYAERLGGQSRLGAEPCAGRQTLVANPVAEPIRQLGAEGLSTPVR